MYHAWKKSINGYGLKGILKCETAQEQGIDSPEHPAKNERDGQNAYNKDSVNSAVRVFSWSFR